MSQEAPRIVDMQNVTLAFEPDVGVFDLSLYVPQGSIFGLIGPSGAGKTTTVRLMVGVYPAQQGTIDVLGSDPVRFGPRMRERIGYMPQHFMLYPELTVRENMRFIASLYGLGWFSRRERINEMLELVEMSDADRRLGRNLSGGMRRRLQLAGALLNEPDLLFADEPTAGIDPALRSRLWEYLQAYRDRGKTLFVTTQYVNEAAYCDLVAVMREGRLLYVDTPEGLRSRALGGEIVAIKVGDDRVFDALRLLDVQPLVRRANRLPGEPGVIHVYVDDSSEAVPDIVELFNEQSDIEVLQAERYEPPFDDIFRILMEKEQVRA